MLLGLAVLTAALWEKPRPHPVWWHLCGQDPGICILQGCLLASNGYPGEKTLLYGFMARSCLQHTKTKTRQSQFSTEIQQFRFKWWKRLSTNIYNKRQHSKKNTLLLMFGLYSNFYFLNKKLKTMILNNKTWHSIEIFFQFIKFGLLRFCHDTCFSMFIIPDILTSLQTC